MEEVDKAFIGIIDNQAPCERADRFLRRMARMKDRRRTRMAKPKKAKLSKKQRIALKIKKIQERGEKEIAKQIARAQGIKDKHGDKTQKLREKMKAQKVAHKAKVTDLKAAFQKKLDQKVAKAIAKAEKKAKRNQDKLVKKLGKVVKTLQTAASLQGEIKAIKAKSAAPRSQHPVEPAVEKTALPSN